MTVGDFSGDDLRAQQLRANMGREVGWLPPGTCGRCRWYDETEPANIRLVSQDGGDVEDVGGIFVGRGLCMYSPPVIVFDVETGKMDSARPFTHGTQRCAQFEEVKIERQKRSYPGARLLRQLYVFCARAWR